MSKLVVTGAAVPMKTGFEVADNCGPLSNNVLSTPASLPTMIGSSTDNTSTTSSNA